MVLKAYIKTHKAVQDLPKTSAKGVDTSARQQSPSDQLRPAPRAMLAAGSCVKHPELAWIVHTMPEGRKSLNVPAAGFERSSYTTI
jgi:hypothetical protein